MTSFIKYLGWALLVSAGTLVAGWVFQIITQIEMPNPVVPAGVLAALGAQLLAQSKNSAEFCEKRSLFFLESCIKAYEQARTLLEDNNNERMKWIAAGRALIYAKELAAHVTESAHLQVLELDRMTYRSFFQNALADKTPAFFYGARNTSISTEEAARESSAPERDGFRRIASSANELSTSSLRAVWEAAQWPTKYEDPLDTEFSAVEQNKLKVSYPGLYEFFEHRKMWRSVAGHLYPKHHENLDQG